MRACAERTEFQLCTTVEAASQAVSIPSASHEVKENSVPAICSGSLHGSFGEQE